MFLGSESETGGEDGLQSGSGNLMQATRPGRADGAEFESTWIPCYHARVIVSFASEGTKDIFHGKRTKAARKTCPQMLWRKAARKLDQLNSADALSDLAAPPGNRLEPLHGDRAGEHSIRINDQYRVCFNWSASGPFRVEIAEYH